MMMKRIEGLSVFFVLLVFILLFPLLARAGSFLFDASKHETAGSADWIIDAQVQDIYLMNYKCTTWDYESNGQYEPIPNQSGIDQYTLETFWDGGISAWGIDLVKRGHTVHTLPNEETVTFGEFSNPYDLSYYDVFIIPEPQEEFSDIAGSNEIQAILDFVAAGGGLFMVADHQTSDRNCSGWDSPHVFNKLMGVQISSGVVTNFGVFGFIFNVQEISGLTTADYWFTDGVDNNVSIDPNDPIISGPVGDGSGGIGLFGSTSMTLNPAFNPTVSGHVWKTDAGGQGTTRVTFVTAEYGFGRITAIGDSSPADDGTGDPGDALYDGWDKASGGVANDIIHLNACEWLLQAADTTPPAITIGPTVTAYDCSATISWTTDEQATSSVNYGLTMDYGSNLTLPGYRSYHDVGLSGLTPETLYHYQVCSDDRAGNGPICSNDTQFTTEAGQAPFITMGPSVINITGTSATIMWTTNESATSIAQYGETVGYGDQVQNGDFVQDHSLIITGLTPDTEYNFRVGSTDNCGNGPIWSTNDTFSSGPDARDISSWVIVQDDGDYSFTLPPGTTITSGGYLILARNSDRAAFESHWNITLGPNIVFLNSNASGLCSGTAGCLPVVNGGESFELFDSTAQLTDGPTISGSSGNANQRIAADLNSGSPTSWTVVSQANANPGSGMSATTGAGVVISEWSDASSGNSAYEFVELFNDDAIIAPDTMPPAAISDLDTGPRGAHSVRISFTATGDDGTSGTAMSYDLRWSLQPITKMAEFDMATHVLGEPMPAIAGLAETIDVTDLAENTTYFFALVVMDEVPNASGLSNWSGCTTAPEGTGGPAPADHLVISEFRVLGPGGANDEFIELYNPTSNPISLNGKSIQYKSATGTTFNFNNFSDDSIPAHHYYLVVRQGSYSQEMTVPHDFSYNSFYMSGTAGHVFLVNKTGSLSTCNDPEIIDKVGYGLSANCPETAVTTTHTDQYSLERLPGESGPMCGNGTDTDDNSADFQLRTPSGPQNSISPGETPCGGAPTIGNVGATLYINGDVLSWGAAYAAASYKIRRHTSPDYVTIKPPDNIYTIGEVATKYFADTDEVPGPGMVYYYFVNAVNALDEESDD